MSYEQFLEKVIEDLKLDFATVFSDKVQEPLIGKREVKKTLGRSYMGLSFQPKNMQTAACIDLTVLYNQYRDGRPYTELLPELEMELISIVQKTPVLDKDLFTDYSKVKPHLTLQILSKEGNEDVLKDVPHFDVEDLSAVFRIDMNFAGYKDGSILITNQLLKQYGITEEDLKRDAIHYAPTSHPATINPMYTFIEAAIGGPPLYVATTKGATYGACVILYPGFLERAAKILKGNFFILPSSVHEVIFLPDNGTAEISDLAAIVTEINMHEVAPEDRLSNSVYYYDMKTGQLTKRSA